MGCLFGVVRWEPALFDWVICLSFIVVAMLRPGWILFGSWPANLFVVIFLSAHIPGAMNFADTIDWKYFAASIYLMFFFLLVFVITRYKWDLIRYFLLGYVTSAALFALASAFDFLTKGRFLGSSLVWMGVRPVGFFKDPNVFGAYLVPALLLSLFIPVSNRAAIAGRVAMFLIILFGLVLSGSRGAWLNAAIAFLVLLIFQLMRKGRFKFRLQHTVTAFFVFLVFVSSASFVLWNFDEQPLTRYLVNRAKFHGYDNGRFANQELLWNMSGLFFWGVGPGRVEQLSNNFASHNSFLRVLIEQGVLGFGVYATVMLSALILPNLAGAARGGDFRKLSPVFGACLAGIMVNSLVIDTLHWRHQWLFLALLFATSRGEIKRCQKF